MISQRIAGIVFTVEIPVLGSAEGPTYLAGDLHRFELTIAAQLAQRGIATGESFRFMRKTLGLTIQDIVGLLAVAATTVKHWETGEQPVPRAAFAVLAAMVADELRGSDTTRRHLAALAAPCPPEPAEVRVTLAGVDRGETHDALTARTG